MKKRGLAKLQLSILIIIIVMASVGTYLLAIRSGWITPTGPFNVTDMSGRTVQIPATVNRVIVLNSYWNEITCILGVSDKIVGIDTYSNASCYIPSTVKNLTIVGNVLSGINIETVLALNPDLVIMDYGYPRTGEILTSLQAHNITVFTLVSNNFDDQITAIRLLGEVFNVEKKADDLATFMESIHSGLLSTAANISANEKPTVLVCKLAVWQQKGQIYAYANSTYGTLVEELGGVNVALRDNPTQSWYYINFETLLAWNPDIIVVLDYWNATLESQLNSINNSSWNQLKAVEDGKLFTLKIGSKESGAYLDWGPRMIIGEMQLAKMIQPNYFANLNITMVINQLFNQFYGYLSTG